MTVTINKIINSCRREWPNTAGVFTSHFARNTVLDFFKLSLEKAIQEAYEEGERECHCNCKEHYVGEKGKGYWVRGRLSKKESK